MAGLEYLTYVMTSHLRYRPYALGTRPATEHRGRRQAERGIEPRSHAAEANGTGAIVHRGAEEVALSPTWDEGAGGGAQYKARHHLGMASPQKLSNEPAQ